MAEPPQRRPPGPDEDETRFLPRDDETELLPPEEDAWPEEETVVDPSRSAPRRSEPPRRTSQYRQPRRSPPPRREEPPAAPPPRRDPPSQRALWPWLLVLLLLVLAGLAAAYLLTRETEPDRVAVPAVVRLPEQPARERLERDGFTVDVERAAADAPVGIVFAQTPGAGRTLERGATVIIHVSEGPDTTTVPNVVGVPEQLALQRLEQADLEVAPQGVFSDEPPGIVVAQDPPAGEEVELGAIVRIAISEGTGLVEVPNVVGLQVDAAETALTDRELEVNVVQVPSREPDGTVVAQNPAGGAEATRGDIVRINVSSGP